MYLESLIRLAETISYFEEKNEFLIDKDFHEQTKSLIESQTEFLINDIKFQESDPGPYTYVFGEIEINIFSPEQTEINEWAIVSRKGIIQKNYRFNSIFSLLKALSMIVND